MEDFIEGFLKEKANILITMFGRENINRFKKMYLKFDNNDLVIILSLSHFGLNYHFRYMNSRIKNGHYTADESRQLIDLIELIENLKSNLEDTSFDFEIAPFYFEKIQEVKEFLSYSGGSTIPEYFQKIQLIEVQPIFLFNQDKFLTKKEAYYSMELKNIGKGSYANVFRYKDTDYNKSFALKRAKRDLTDKEFIRFRREFDSMQKLSSPYILDVYTFNEEKQEYIMEYADNTLKTYIDKHNNSLKMADRISLAKQILDAFIYINQYFYHRDISFNNILVKTFEHRNIIKVSDFGLVKYKDSFLTDINTEHKGAFNDPNLKIIGFEKYNSQHEVYALTHIIHFVMTGKTKLEGFPSKSFENFVQYGMSPDLNQRYGSVSELKKAFNESIKPLYF